MMQMNLSALNMPFEIFEAADGCDLTRSERAFMDDAARRRVSRFPLSDSEIGCWHSHRRIMLKIAEQGPEIAAVLEDDAGLSQHFPRVLRAIEQSRASFDFIDLHRIFRGMEIFYPCCNLCEGFDLGRIRYLQMRLTGYVISRQGARKFLAGVPRFAHAVDKSMKRWWSNGLSYFVLSQPVVTHDDYGCSLIDGTRALRVPFAEADAIHWRATRLFTRLSDSVRMRIGFPGYLREGRRAAQAGFGSASPTENGRGVSTRGWQ